jgi:hypothetical protein
VLPRADLDGALRVKLLANKKLGLMVDVSPRDDRVRVDGVSRVLRRE